MYAYLISLVISLVSTKVHARRKFCNCTLDVRLWAKEKEEECVGVGVSVSLSLSLAEVRPNDYVKASAT